MPKCFSAWNAVLNKSVTMHFRHEKQMKHNGTRWMNILIFYSLIMSFSCATCMSTLGFCIIIFLFSGSLPTTTSQYYFLLQSLHKVLPSTTLYYKACTKHFPVLLCTTKLAQSTSQYYFVLQSLHRALPSTTLYYKACTKHFPVLLCTTKLAQNTSQYYFVPQSLHKALPSTTLYYKACTKHFPVLLCTTKLAQSTSQSYFVLQNEHFVRDLLQFWRFRHVIKQVGMWQSATPATQDDMTTCLETFEKERFCSFPHRHGINDATPTRRRRDADPTTTRRATGGEQTLRYAFGKNRIIWDEHPKSSNHQLNAILPITNQHTHNLEFCMLIVISYVIS